MANLILLGCWLYFPLINDLELTSVTIMRRWPWVCVRLTNFPSWLYRHLSVGNGNTETRRVGQIQLYLKLGNILCLKLLPGLFIIAAGSHYSCCDWWAAALPLSTPADPSPRLSHSLHCPRTPPPCAAPWFTDASRTWIDLQWIRFLWLYLQSAF